MGVSGSREQEAVRVAAEEAVRGGSSGGGGEGGPLAARETGCGRGGSAGSVCSARGASSPSSCQSGAREAVSATVLDR